MIDALFEDAHGMGVFVVRPSLHSSGDRPIISGLLVNHNLTVSAYFGGSLHR